MSEEDKEKAESVLVEEKMDDVMESGLRVDCGEKIGKMNWEQKKNTNLLQI